MTPAGDDLQKEIINKIVETGSTQFLFKDESYGYPGFREEQRDIQGITIDGKEIASTRGDDFKAVDLSYSHFYRCSFKNTMFLMVDFSFTSFHDCEFVDCAFYYGGFFSSTLSGTKFTNCDFTSFSITNSELRGVKMENCFFEKNVFYDCKFDEKTIIEEPMKESKRFKHKFSNTFLSDIYKGIREGYLAGKTTDLARTYFFKERCATTRHNKKCTEKAKGYIIEWTTGYGIRPWRVVATMLLAFSLLTGLLISKTNFLDGLLLGAGAFLTFGANAHLLNGLSVFYKTVYIAEAFSGISLTALLITVLARYWFSEE